MGPSGGMDSRQWEHISLNLGCSWEMQVIVATVCIQECSHEGRKPETPSDKAEYAKQRSTYMLIRKRAATKSLRARNKGGRAISAVFRKGSPGSIQ